jgi:hypothetical protein
MYPLRLLGIRMTEGEIPNRLPHALRVAVFWISLPFIFLLVGVERIFDPLGDRYQVGGCFAAAFLSILVAVYWNRLLPLRWQSATDPPLAYLRDEDSELGPAIRNMAWRSAWSKWYASQSLATNNHRPADEAQIMNAAASNVRDALMDGKLEARGQRRGHMEYETIPRTHWRSSVPHMIKDNVTLWKMILIPTGGAEFGPNGAVTGHDPAATHRTEQLAAYDSLIINSRQFEKLWPRKDKDTDAARRRLLKTARKAGAAPAEIEKLSRY